MGASLCIFFTTPDFTEIRGREGNRLLLVCLPERLKHFISFHVRVLTAEARSLSIGTEIKHSRRTETRQHNNNNRHRRSNQRRKGLWLFIVCRSSLRANTEYLYLLTSHSQEG
ncbi:hypothetical protein ElyMa_003796600 [Elysia marginata]|uniref:Uncharacterized protein n=1 Tax=Elysia marginata TaxID=1093978 RepID=A0AAV4FEN3_9GAST|nr:hypothetical protein ElyMa_003796600 [Elysia marginata]